MKRKKFVLTAKRFLIITFSITVLIMTVMWAFGIRFEHLKILKLIFSEPMELSAKEKAEVHDWLQQEPDMTAKSLLKRLQYEYPGRFVDGQLRTLQRRVKEWRKIMAHELIYSCKEY